MRVSARKAVRKSPFPAPNLLCATDVLEILRNYALNGTAIQKNYIILFGIVRLAGLYELIAQHTPESGIRLLDHLYHDMNQHLSKISASFILLSFVSNTSHFFNTVGLNGPTDAYEFSKKWTALADWRR